MAGIKARIPQLLATVKAHGAYLDHNFSLFDIHQGNLLQYIVQELRRQLTGQSAVQAERRIPPINVLRRIVDKQSKIYAQGVSRSVVDGRDSDAQLLAWYEQVLQPNRRLAIGNRYFNLFKNTLLWPYLSAADKIPRLRVIPSDRFVPYSTDPMETDRLGGVILVIGNRVVRKKGKPDRTVMIYQAVEPDEFVYFTSEEDDVTAEYAPENPQGENSLGRIPAVYVNRDDQALVPTQDSDTFAMTVLLPVLLTDINFAHMFQAFSILYGINVTDQGLKFAPNAFWSFKSEPGADKPEVGTIKGQADISAGLELVAAQFSLWLNTKGIKPGAIGEINAANFASGVAKMLDEMDTSEDRNEQVPYFADAEADLWDLILNTLHPVWLAQGMDGMRTELTQGAKVVANFAEQVPLVRRGAVVEEQTKERAAGFTTWRRAVKRINPQMTDQDIDALAKEIAEEEAARRALAGGTPPDDKGDAKGKPEPGGADGDDEDGDDDEGDAA